MRRLAASLGLAAGLLVQTASAQKASSDDRIYDQVRMKITTDPDVKGGNLDVSVKDGVVTIKGRVDTEKARDRATKLAKKVKGVKQVDNQLSVGPPAS
jgi:osmotically-inducible protein OsmY